MYRSRSHLKLKMEASFMCTTKKKYSALLLSAAFAVTVFTGCSHVSEVSPSISESTPAFSETTSYAGGLADDGKGTLQEAGLMGEWLYEAHGCILRFEENGRCLVMYEGTDYECSYVCENDQVLLTYEDQTAVGELRENGMLYFNGSAIGFLTENQWEQDGILNEAEMALNAVRSRQEAADAMAGILYLGYYENLTPFDEAWKAEPAVADALARYPFLALIEEDRFARNEGSEIYCIIPTDEGSSVTVTVWDAETNSPGEILFSSEDGRPIWIQGNISDIMPNLSVTIEDSSGNVLQQYQPFISLKDGTVAMPAGAGSLVLDLTEYDFPVDSET